MKTKDQYALISVFDKINLNFVCKVFKKNNIKIISTGSTSKHIKKLGYNCISVSNLTKFKEILDGRVKTIHPKIHASLLYKRSDKNHIKSFKKLNFPTINFVIVNLYPFEKTIKLHKSNNEKAIEMIDIGGPALLRSAAKNYEYITTVSNPNDYKSLINNNFIAYKLNDSESIYFLNLFDFKKHIKDKLILDCVVFDNSISTIEQLKNVRDQIENFIKESKDFDTKVGLAVRVDKFSDSSIDMYVRCFTQTDSWNEWLKVKERLAIGIKEIVEKNKASFAFPSQSIYVEKK